MKKAYYIVIVILTGIIIWNEFSRENRSEPKEIVRPAPQQKKSFKKRSPIVFAPEFRKESGQSVKRYTTVLQLKSQAAADMLFKLAPRYDVKVTSSITQIHLYRVSFSSRDLLDELISLLPGLLELAEQVTFKSPPPPDSPAKAGFANGLNTIWRVPQLKDSGRGVVIAVLDSGVADLKYFKQKIKHIDLVGDGKPLSNSHGTSVASVIIGNSEDVPGIAPSAQILDIRVMDNEGEGSGFIIAQGIVAAVDKGADIINLSLGSPSSSPVLQAAVEYAVNRDVIMIAAVGNENLDSVSYPAAYDDVIGVGAVDENENHLSFSNRGPEVDLSAPGLSIPTYNINNEKVLMTGTSFATPIVAGTLAYLKSKYPRMSNSELVELIAETTNDMGLPDHDNHYGDGVVNIQRAANEDKIYDVAVADAVVVKNSTTGRWDLTCSAENRGSETIKSIQMRIETNNYSDTVYFRNIEPNATFSETISLRTPPTSATISVTASFVSDSVPENNEKTISFLNK